MPDNYDRKYLVAVVFLMAMAVIALANLIDETLHQRWHGVFLYALTALICLCASVYVRPHRTYPRLYWFLAVELTATCLYFVASSSHHGGSLFWLYFLPSMACYFLGIGSGILVSGATFVLACLMIFGALPTEFAYPLEVSLRFALSFSLLTIVTVLLDYSRRGYVNRLREIGDTLRQEKQQLATALGDVKTLKGLLPTCASCKSIRDKHGHWHPIEEYISARSEAGFSHSICPSCTKTLYPDLELPDVAGDRPFAGPR